MTSDSTLRDHLRDATRPHHDRVDEAFSRLDLSNLDDYRLFLDVNYRCLTTMARARTMRSTHFARHHVPGLRRRLAEDLFVLDVEPSEGAAALDASPHPAALDYVVLGARIGAKVLRRSWESRAEGRLRQASAFFTAPDATADWRAFCETARSLPSDDPDSEKIVLSAVRLFDLFETELKRDKERRDGAPAYA